MIGQTIRSNPRFPWAAWFFLLMAAALIGLAVATQNPHPAIGALLPLLLGIVLLLARERSIVAEFTEQGIEVNEPPTTVLYDRIEGLRAPKRPRDPAKPGPRAYPIDVLHRDGVLQIPKHLDVPSDDVFLFLYPYLTTSGARDVSPALADYLQQQVSTFGPDKVWSYRARAHLGSRSSTMAVFSAVIAVTGVIWILTTVLGRPFDGWAVAGSGALLVGLMLLIVVVATPRARVPAIKKWRESGLVISPAGMALIQGDLRGELKWAELKDVRYQPKPRNFWLTPDQSLVGIVLMLEGAKFAIVNIYDRPLRVIHERILQYWR